MFRAGRPSFRGTPTLSKKGLRQRSFLRFYSSPAVLEIRPGAVVNQLLLPLDSSKYSFPLRPSDTLRQFLQDIRTEKPSINEIIVTNPQGVRISQSTPVSTLLKSGFGLKIDQQNFQVLPPAKATTPDSVLAVVDVQDLCMKVYCQKIRKRITEERRHHISYSEYESWCAEYGLNAEQAKNLAMSLHYVGDILYFHMNPTLKSYIFLSPTYVTSNVAKALGLKFMKIGHTEILHELETIMPEYLELNQKKLEYDRRATVSADRWMKMAGVYLVVQFAILAKMVWIDFNWDIMEPVTYFVTLGGTIIGYMFFVLFKVEYTYMALKERQVNKNLRKLYLKNEFPWTRWNELDQRIHALVHDLGHANVPAELQTVWKNCPQKE